MATLNGQQIDQTYPGLIKTNDEAGIGGVVKTLQDGVGTDLPMQVSTTTVAFTGNVVGDNNTTYDLASAQNASDVDVTLTGSDATTDTVKLVAGTNVTLTDSGTNQITIDAAGGGGAAGLESGSGADSMQSAAALTTVGANASGADSISLGDNSQAAGGSSIAIGNGAQVTGLYEGIAIGQNAQSPSNGTAVGPGASTVGNQGNAFGKGAIAHDQALAAGRQTTATGTSATSVGDDCDATGARSIAMGRLTQSTNADSIAIGTSANASGGESIAIGNNARGAGGVGIAIGNNAHAQNNEAMAIGPDAFASGNAGTIAIGRQSDSTAIDAVAVGRLSNASGSYSAAFGRSADAQGEQAISVGYDATATGDQSIAIGDRANATAQDSVAIGQQVVASTANTVSVKALETQIDSTPTAGGIIMSDAGGTDRRLNITSNGTLQVDSASITKAFSTTKVSETQATSSCDTIRASVLIPANTYAADDILEVRSMESISDTTGWVYPELWISTVGTIGGVAAGVNVGQAHSSSNGKAYYQKTLYVQGATTDHWPTTDSNEGASPQQVTGGDAIQSQSIDWTVDQYLVVKCCIDNSGATWTNYGAVIRKIN